MQTIALRTFAFLVAPFLFFAALGVAVLALPGKALRYAFHRPPS